MEKRIIKRYSEAFKRQVVGEDEAGASSEALRRKYGIGGKQTIGRWVRQYSHAGLRDELVFIHRAEERGRERALQQRVRDLEAAVAQLTLEKIVLEATLAETERRLGEDVKKKPERPSSRAATNTR